MASQECDLQIILRKLNEIDKRTKDNEQALKLLGRGLIDGSIGGGGGGSGGAQLVSNRATINAVDQINQATKKFNNSIIDLRALQDKLEMSIRQASGGRTLDDLQAGGANLRGVSNDAREAKVTALRIEKVLKELVVPIGVIDSTVKRSDKRINDMQFIVKKTREDVADTKKLANDSYAALKVFSPLIRETRKLANDTFAGIVSLSPIIRATATKVNDGLFVINKIRAIVGGFEDNFFGITKLLSQVNFKADSILTAIKSIPNYNKQLTDLMLALAAIAFKLKDSDNTSLINAAWNNLAQIIRGEHSITRGSLGAAIVANTSVINGHVTSNANALNNRIIFEGQGTRTIVSTLDGVTRGAILASLTANASAINAFTKRELDALFNRLNQTQNTNTKIEAIYKYCHFDFDMQGYTDFAEWDEQDRIVRSSPTVSFENNIKAYGAALFTAQPVDPNDSSKGNLPVGQVKVFSAYQRNLVYQALAYYRAGLHRLPASVPETLNYVPTQQAPTPPMVAINNAVDLAAWQWRQTEGTLGFFPTVIKHKGKDDVVRDIKIETVADGFAELMGLSLINDGDTDVILESVLRIAGDVIQAKAAASLGADIGRNTADFLGYRYEQNTKKMPTNINPRGESLEDVLKESELDVVTHNLKEPNDNDIITKINRLIMICGMLQAGFHKRFPVPGVRGLDGDTIKQQLQTSDVEWEEFLVWLKTQYARTPDLGQNDGLSRVNLVDKSSRLANGANPP